VSSRPCALRIGAGAYDPEVVALWEGFQPVFPTQGAQIDFVLESAYDAQLEANLSGKVDLSWNSPIRRVKGQFLRFRAGRGSRAG
jgi:hypothetical protein